MGNLCGRLNSRGAKVGSDDVFRLELARKIEEADSITIPSKCESASFTYSIKDSHGSRSSESFTWSRMMNVVLEQQTLTDRNLTRDCLRVTSHVVNALKRNLRQMCDDILQGVHSLPETVTEKFKPLVDKKKGNLASVSQHGNIGNPVTKKILVHLVSLVFYHDVILGDFREKRNAEALDFLKQIAVSHALRGVTPMDFRYMDWFLIYYLVKNKLVNDENLNNFINYLNVISNQIERFYESQSVRGDLREDMNSDKPDNDRKNKCRENYRIMKKWAAQVENYKQHEQIIEGLLGQQETETTMKLRETSIDTLTLKQQDCIMKHFVKKRNETDSDTISLPEQVKTKSEEALRTSTKAFET